MQSLWMVFAALNFSLANLTIKLLGHSVDSAQILFFRGLIAVCCLVIWCVATRQTVWTNQPKLHLSRSISGVGSVALYTYVLTALPMVTAVTMNYTSPIWLVIFTVLMAVFKRTKQPPLVLILCIFTSMSGVILLLKPVFESGNITSAVMGLLSGFLSAVAYWQIKSLSKTGEAIIKIVFYHSFSMMIGGGIWWLWTQFAVHWLMVPWLIITALLTLTGQLSMTYALSKGPTLLTSNLMYLTVLFTAVLGIIFTKDGSSIDTFGYFGIILIIGSSMVAATFTPYKQNKISSSNN